MVSNFVTVSDGGGGMFFNCLALFDGGGYVGKYWHLFERVRAI